MGRITKEDIKWTVSPHAKQRAWERYGIRFSPRVWSGFCRFLQKENNLIRLENNGSVGCRFACRFQGQWFFIGCSLHGGFGMVTTFLPPNALTDADKTILASDERYTPVDSAAWNVVRPNVSGRTAAERRTRLSNIKISQDELPPDFDHADKLLDGS